MYTLENVEEINREHPQTFHIHSEHVRSNLQIGQYAKLIFLIDGWAERMWVRITKREGGKYWGDLDNAALDPSLPDLGSEVVFGKEHVADYL
jgi:hypothetical protein